MPDRSANQPPLVSLILPIRNEAAYLERALDAINSQTYPSDRIEIIVVDGGSTDGTLVIVQERMARDPRISLLGGPGVNTPMAMRIGIEAAAGNIIAKVDGHGWMNDQFVDVAVASLLADPGLGCVGGIIEPVATSPLERAIAIARFSRFGVGGGVYTLSERTQETDTVQCGAYRRAALDDAGGFDAAMAYGEDEELNHRVRSAGWRILLHAGMRFSYRVRPTLGALFRQYIRYGRARMTVVRKHASFFRPKHAAPAALIVSMAATLMLAPFPGWRVLTLIVWGGYLILLLSGALSLAVRHRFARLDLLAGSLIALHFGYGLGTLRGMFDRATASSHGRTKGFERLPGTGTEGDGMPDESKAEQQQG